jgi:hypothetical protein
MNEASIFAAALEKAAGTERQAFLDEACAGDAALRQRIERLLAADRQSAGILERGPEATGLEAPAASGDFELLCPSTVIGPYKLIEQIGEGGMGTVWMAQQTEQLFRREGSQGAVEPCSAPTTFGPSRNPCTRSCACAPRSATPPLPAKSRVIRSIPNNASGTPAPKTVPSRLHCLPFSAFAGAAGSNWIMALASL